MLSMKARLICLGIELPPANRAASPFVGRQFSARVRQGSAKFRWLDQEWHMLLGMFMAMA
jgi:hypothetical protein